MIRRIIHIDEDKCTGCGLCAKACHESAIAIVDGKAKLIRDDYCDGMGDCLPNCPEGAITFEEREALPYDREAVEENMRKAKNAPGISRLENWPVQLRLAPVTSAHFDGKDLLIAADCTAFAYGSFHRDFIDGKTVLIGCPKLDGVDYAEKLSDIFSENDILSITVVRMQVPCCGGLLNAVQRAVLACGKKIPVTCVTISSGGEILA